MRVFQVVGKVSLQRAHPTLIGKRWVLAVPLPLAVLAGKAEPTADEIVVLDELGASPGAWLGVSEGAEAAAPYAGDKKPVDAYAALLLDRLDLHAESVEKMTAQ